MNARPTPDDFGDPVAELDHALHRSILVDRSGLSRLLGTGPDLLDLLQRLSTGDLAAMAEGSGRSTVLTTPKGRIVERLLITRLSSGVLMVAGEGNGPRVLEHIARFTFAEQTGLTEIGDDTRLFAIAGPTARDVLESANLPRPERYGAERSSIAGCEVDVIGHGGESAGDFSVLVGRSDDATSVWTALEAAVRKSGGGPGGKSAMEARRILLGIPSAGLELTDDYNPLEAGLTDAIAFDKGCYVGQEVIARLNTYDKVSRALLGLGLPEEERAPEPGSALFHEGTKIGEVTSSVHPPGGRRAIALGYVKTRTAGPGTSVRIGTMEGSQAELVRTPFDLGVAGVNE